MTIVSCPARGELINLKARLGAEWVRLDERIPELEKIAQKLATPGSPDFERVLSAKAELRRLNERRPILEAEHKKASDALDEW